MRALFYRHKPWQKLNLLLMCIGLCSVMFWHGVLNTIAVANTDGAQSTEWQTLYTMLSNFELLNVFTSSLFWSAQFSGFLSVFQQPMLWFSWLWLPASIALIILIQAFAMLLNTPRWLRSVLLLTIGFALAWAIPQLITIADSAQALGIPAHVALYFSVAATWSSAARVRGHHSH